MTANHESYLLMASTQNDMEDWVKSIRRVIWGPFGGGIFGQKLEDTVRYEKRYGNRLAPMLVEQCVDFIRQRGLKEEGLFRLPGQANLVKELQDAFDCGEKPSFDSNTDVHTVASLLKLYLRELPEQDFYVGNFEDPVLDGPPQDDLSHPGDYENKSDRRSVGGRSSRATSSSDNSETFVGNTSSNHSALHSLVSSLKQEMTKQKIEYESRIKSLEQRNLTLETEMLSLHDELDQERKKFTMIEIKMRNAERAKEDAEKRNDMLQKEMEQFFSTFGDLTVEPRRSERGNTIWIQ